MGSWSTFAFLVIVTLLVAANVATVTGRQVVAPECNPRPRGLLAVAPSLFAVSGCCGDAARVVSRHGGDRLLFEATPWLLFVTIAMLEWHLMVMGRFARLPAAAIEPTDFYPYLKLALFRLCSADERNARQSHDISRHLQKQA